MENQIKLFFSAFICLAFLNTSAQVATPLPGCIPPYMQINQPQPVCGSNRVNITLPAITSGSVPGLTFTYWFDASANSNPIPNPQSLGSGTYYIKGTSNSNACPAIGAVQVTVAQTPSQPVLTTTASCNGTATIFASFSGGNIVWSTGANTSSIVVNSSGNYTAYVTNGSCNSTTASIQVTVTGGVPQPSIEVVNNCNGTSTLTAQNYSYPLQWSNGQQTSSITVTQAGNYSLIQTNNGCSSTPVFALASPKTAPPAPSIEVVNNCNGTSTLTAQNYSYPLQWSNGQQASSIIVTQAGNYSLIQTNNGCSSTPVFAVASPKTAPPAPSIEVANHCNGTSTLTARNYSYPLQWSNGQQANSIVVNQAGVYTLVQSNNGCTSAAATATASPETVPPTLNVTVQNHCNGTSTLTAQNVIGNVFWSDGSTTSSIQVQAAGTYSVYQNRGNCQSNIASVVAAPKQSPSAPIVSIQYNCNGTAVLQTDKQGGILLWNNVQESNFLNVSGSGTYTVSYTINGCSSATVSGSYLILPFAASVQKVDENCQTGAKGTITITATGSNGPYTYWLDNTNMQNQNVFTNVTPGNHIVKAVSRDGCEIILPVAIEFTQTATLSATVTETITHVTCYANATGAIQPTINFEGGITPPIVTYSWTKQEDLAFTASSLALNNVTAGHYKLDIYAKETANGCPKKFTKNITINQPSIIVGSISGTDTVMQFSVPSPAVRLSASGGSFPYTFRYTVNNGAVQSIAATVSTNISQSTGTVGIFQYNLVSVTDANGCTAAVDKIATVTVLKAKDPTDTVPDIGISLRLLPTILRGKQDCVAYVTVNEINGIATKGDIRVFINKDVKLKLDYNEQATVIDGFPVQNSKWSVDSTTALDFYIFTFKDKIPPNGSINFGTIFHFSSLRFTGKMHLTALIRLGDGGDTKVISNNSDSEQIIYFIE